MTKDKQLEEKELIEFIFLGTNLHYEEAEQIGQWLYNIAGYRKQIEGEWEWHTELHGNPIDGMDEDFGYRCSNCKVWASEYGVDGDIYEEPPTSILPFCPHCGAKMKGGER